MLIQHEQVVSGTVPVYTDRLAQCGAFLDKLFGCDTGRWQIPSTWESP